MGRNQRRRANRKGSSSAKSTVKVVTPTSPQPAKGFSYNFSEFIFPLLAPLLFTLIIVVPILSGFHLIRPEAAIIAEPIVTGILFVAALLSAGIFPIKKIDPFHPKNPKLARNALIAGVLLSLLLIGGVLPYPSAKPKIHPGPQLAAIPYPPYKGVLVLDGMQSRPSKGYYWQ